MSNAAKLFALMANTPLSVSFSPDTATAEGGNGTLTTNTVTVTPSDGVSPYTYSWTVDNIGVTITASTSATTAFRATGNDEVLDATASCTVTDSGGESVSTGSIQVSFFFGNPP